MILESEALIYKERKWKRRWAGLVPPFINKVMSLWFAHKNHANFLQELSLEHVEVIFNVQFSACCYFSEEFGTTSSKTGACTLHFLSFSWLALHNYLGIKIMLVSKMSLEKYLVLILVIVWKWSALFVCLFVLKFCFVAGYMGRY